MDFFSILMLLGGLALFLYGMNAMGDGLKQLSGGKLESILGKLTSNRIKGFFLGFVVTSIIQSSSATTVMLVGFVNSGIMKLGQTISIIMGANIGTTVTAWLLSTTGISGDSFFIRLFKPESFTPILAAIGVIMTMVCKSDKKKDVGTIFIGFAILMFGMETMSDSMAGLKDSPSFSRLLTMFSNPVMGILSGMLLTAIIQSSSASVGILQALAQTGIIPFSTAMPIVMGQNIGTTITPVISSVNGNRDSKRVAVACVYIKMIGVIIFATVFYTVNMFVHFKFMQGHATAFSIALFHTTFNVISTVLLMPFCSAIEKLTVITIKGKSSKETDAFLTLDDRFLSIPTFAVEKCRLVVNDMAELAKKSLEQSLSLVNEYDKAIEKEITENENEVDLYEDKTSSYLLKISAKQLSAKDNREVSQLLHVIGDVERISDHSVNIMQAAREIHDKNIEFSADALREIGVISNAVREVLSLAIGALVDKNLDTAKKVEPLEQIIDKLKYKIKNNHIKRLREGACTIEMGFVLSDLLNNFERVADHCSNIAVCLLEIDNNSFETHEYLNHVKQDGENEFFEQYDAYKKRYSI